MIQRPPRAFPLARRELEFMNILWDLGEATAQQVQDALEKRGQKLRESTVRTILRVLGEKEFVEYRIAGRAYVYKARFPRKTARSMGVRDVANRLFNGSISAMAVYLISEEKLSPTEKKELRQNVRKALGK